MFNFTHFCMHFPMPPTIYDPLGEYTSSASSTSMLLSKSLLLLPVLLMILSLVDAIPYQRPPSYADAGGRCGPEHDAVCGGMCCSAAGYCGTTEEFCSVPNNCQEAWGWCDSKIMPQGADITRDTRKFNQEIPAKVDRCTVPNTLALTFDDGPSNYTNAILDVLKEHNARATFFVAGVNNAHSQIDIKHAATIRRMIMEGHQIGSHTWSHPNLDKLSSADRKMELWKNERAITNIIGKMPTFMRPPMVICGDACMKDMSKIGYHVVGWEVDSQDWHDPQPSVTKTISRLALEMYNRPNMFLIQHDTSSTAVEVLKGMLHFLPSNWTAVPLVECLGYSLDDAFRFPSMLEHNGIVADGCLVAGPSLCAPAQKFNTKGECQWYAAWHELAADGCEDSVPPTLGLLVPARTHCRQMSELSSQWKKFCNQCKGSKCDHGHLKYGTEKS